MRELLHSRSGHGKHHHRSEADHRETSKAAAWAVFQHHGGGGVHRHNLYGHAVRRVTRFKIEAQMKHAMAHHSTSHMPTDTIHVNWDAGSTLFDSFELDSLCKQLGRSFHPVVKTPHPPNQSSDEIGHPKCHAYANPDPNLGPPPYPRPPPQHGHPGLHDLTEDADAHHYQVGRGVSLVDGVLVPITVRGSPFRLTRNGRRHGDGHGSGMHTDDDVGKLVHITGHGHAHAHGHHHHGKLANMYRWWKEHHHKRQPSEKTSSDDESASKDEFDDLHAHDRHKSLRWKLTHLFHHSHHHHHDHHDVSLNMSHGAHNRIAPHDAVEKGHKGRGNHITAKLLDHISHKHHHRHGDEGDKYHHEDHASGHHGRGHGGKHNASARQDLYIAKDVDLPRGHHKWQEDFDHHNHHHHDDHHHLHLSHMLKSGLRMVLPRTLCRSVDLFHDKDDSDLEDSVGYDFHHHLDPHSLSNNKGDLHHDNNYNFGNDHDGIHIVHKEGEGQHELEYHHDHHHHYHHHHVHHREEKHDYELTVQAIGRRVPRKSFEQMARRLSIEEIDLKAPRNSLENFEERVRRSSGEDRHNSPQNEKAGAFSEVNRKRVEEEVNTYLQSELKVNALRTW